MTTPTPTVGQFTASPLAGVQTAATQIAASSQTTSEAAGLAPSLRQATIVTVDATTPPTCTVTFDSTTNVAGIQFLESYFPVVNDTVFCVVLSGTTWILGQLAPVSPLVLTVPSLSVTGTGTVATLNATGTGTVGTLNVTNAVTASTFKDAAPGIWDVNFPYVAHHHGSYYVQRGTNTFVTAADGHGNISYADWFPVATDVVMVCNGDSSVAAFASVAVDNSTVSNTGFNVVCRSASGAALNAIGVRVNWIAYGH